MTQPLREFLYVDADRVRSLLTQLQGLAVEALMSPSEPPSRSVQDLTFVAFEHLANEHLLVTDLGAPFFDPDYWESGAVHKQLRPGDLVRIEADVQILDGGLFETRLHRLDALLDAYLTVSGQGTVPLGSKGGGSRQQLGAAWDVAKKQAFGGMDREHLLAIAEFVKAFVGESIAVRVLPCGVEHLDYGFTGALLGWKAYVQDDRDTLFSRYGNIASRWTAVLQIAAIPERARDEVAVDTEVLDASGNLNRAAVERVATQLLAMMESVGIAEGARWPSVSVTPLAFYREVPPAI